MTATARPALPDLLPDRPVISGFHPDPTVCRVGEAFYLACSSFEYAPGVPVFRSIDLVGWELVGHALHSRTQLDLSRSGPSGGVYAPTLRYHDGRFWLITTNVSDGPGHLLVTATDPPGPWSDPVRIRAVGGIDPDLAWDDDGTCYLTWTDGGIVQAVLDPATGDLLSEPQRLWSGTGGKHPEGPHLYRIGSWWYLLVAEGGTGHGHAATVARGQSPSGPFEPSPHNPVLTARGKEGPVQNTGHADLVQRPDGSWAMVFLGVRPKGHFPGWHVLGRETFAVEIGWEDGWPHVRGPIQPEIEPSISGGLGDGALPPEWVGAGMFPEEVLERSSEGWVLTARGERSFVGRRQEHHRMTARAQLHSVDGVGGLELRLDPDHAVSLDVDGERVRAVARVGPLAAELGDSAWTPAAVLELRAEPSSDSHRSKARGPDEIVAVAHTDAGPNELARIDGRYLASEVSGGFTGRMVGLSCTRGSVEVRRFEYFGGSSDPM